MWKRAVKRFIVVLGVLLLPASLLLLHYELRRYNYHDIVRNLRAFPGTRIGLALLLTFLNYLVLTGYDILGLRFIRRSLPYYKACLASFVGFAVSNNLGFFLFSSTLVRLGMYSNWGLSALEVAGIIAFNSITYWLGLLAVGGFMLFWEPIPVPDGIPLLAASLQTVGVLFLGIVAFYFTFCVWRRRPLRMLGREIPVPSPRMALFQLAISMLDWLLAAAVFFVLLPGGTTISFAAFFGIFVLAQLLGVASQVPGGLGVFDTAIVLLLKPVCTADLLVTTLVAYRTVYYLLPLATAGLLLGGYEAARRRQHAYRYAQALAGWLPLTAPPVFTVLVFGSGVLLLFSGATPAIHERLTWLAQLLPLSVIETSHFLAGLIGMALLLLARGLHARLTRAYLLTVVLLGAGWLFSLLKGVEYEEATVLAVLFLSLLPCRGFFYRQTSLLDERFSPRWLLAIGTVLVAFLWLGTFSHQYVVYRHDLWWQVALYGDAPRFLRTMVGVVGVALLMAILRRFRPTIPKPEQPTPAELARVSAIVAAGSPASAKLALLGDKSLFFSPGGNAFILYGISGRSWVALGDPLGAAGELRETAWEFRELCDRYHGACVFYEVCTENLPLYLDLGLTPLKIGEEARVRLAEFSLDDGRHQKLRQLCDKLEDDGVTFDVVSPEQVRALLPEFRRVSDAWLAAGDAREKGVSRGFFAEEYLIRFPAAMVRRHGRVVAFATLWANSPKDEYSLDLLRHGPESPSDCMDYFVTRLVLWGKQQGYEWFSLGMAPLAGREEKTRVSGGTEKGRIVYRHGELFSGPDDLRGYKQKFAPVWEPRYLAYPGRLNLSQVLGDVAALLEGCRPTP